MIKNLLECPYHLLSRCSQLVTSHLKKELSNADLDIVKPAYISILICLWEKEKMDSLLSKFGYHDGMKMVDLGRSAALESSTMTGLIDRMERDGLVERSTDLNDRRALRISLTQPGSKLQESVMNILEGTTTKVFSQIPETKMVIAKQTLKQVLVDQDDREKKPVGKK